MRALQKAPSARFADVSAFARALEDGLQRASAASTLPCATRQRSTAKTQDGESAAGRRGRALLLQAEEAFERNDLDDAVRFGEELVELAAFGGDQDVYAVVRHGMALLDRIFAARVGPPDRQLALTARARDPNDHRLSSKARLLLERAEGGTVGHVLGSCAFPRRAAVRMLAGLMVRGLITHSDPLRRSTSGSGSVERTEIGRVEIVHAH